MSRANRWARGSWSDTRSHELMSDLLRRPGFDRRYFADTGTHLQPCNTSCSCTAAETV